MEDFYLSGINLSPYIFWSNLGRDEIVFWDVPDMTFKDIMIVRYELPHFRVFTPNWISACCFLYPANNKTKIYHLVNMENQNANRNRGSRGDWSRLTLCFPPDLETLQLVVSSWEHRA